jgi:predicted alpha/beta-hydrolase family hydrolase
MTRKIKTSHGPVSYAIDGTGDGTVVVLGHGAGADMHSDFMSVMAAGIAAAGSRVVRFNFLYSEARKKAPDRQPVLEQTFTEVAEFVSSELAPEKLVIGGKSMGGRMASYVAASGAVKADGLLFLGYPLHAPGRPDRMRADHLSDISIPMLFLEGTRDPFCPLDTLRPVVAKLDAPVEISVIEDGDHSFKVRRSSGRTTEDAWNEAIGHVTHWLKTIK